MHPSTEAASPAELSTGTRIKTLAQFAYPQHLLSGLMYAATRVRFRPWKNWQIRWFTARYGVNLSESVRRELHEFPDFNSFFTRALHPGARPIEGDETVVSAPADGMISEFGDIDSGTLMQAKGRTYSVSRLIGHNHRAAAEFEGGRFLTIYLAPHNYHRVHMPLAGRLREMVHIPGRLFSVNAASTQLVPNLLARNERVVSIFDTEAGAMAIVLVGAFWVGCIDQVWAGTVTPPRKREIAHWRYGGSDLPAVALQRGEEMGHFNMGSTVVALFSNADLSWRAELQPGGTVRYGEGVARWG